MKKELQNRVEQLNIKHRRRTVWYRIVSVLACITVFITTYALILPAVTMDEDEAAVCGMIDHQHTEECYETVIIPGEEYLVCGQDEHVHSDACYDGRGRLICGQRAHTHRNSCYERTEPIEERRLVCDLPEHEHDMACFTPAVSIGDYTCGFEYEHTHGESCYENGTLVCSMQEHVHSEACRNYTLSQAAVGGIGVDVIGAQDAFPCNIRNVRLTAENVHSESLMELLKEAAGGEAAEGASMTVLDVSLWNSGKAIEPTGFVTVRLSGMVGENETARVFHLDEEAGTVTEMTAYVDGNDILFETDHFSYYGITTEAVTESIGDNFSLSFSAEWGDSGLTTPQVTVSNALAKILSATLQSTTDTGDPVSWTDGSTYSIPKYDKGKVGTYSVDFTFGVGFNLDTSYRFYITNNENGNKFKDGYTESFTILDFYEAALPGFSEWLEDVYDGEWGEARPTTLAALNAAAAFYDNLPEATIEKVVQTKSGGPGQPNREIVGAEVSVDPAGNYSYFWQYMDPSNNNTWTDFDGPKNNAVLDGDKIAHIIDQQDITSGRLKVRCIAVPQDGVIQGGPGTGDTIDPNCHTTAVSNALSINPDSVAIQAAIQEINDGLGLAAIEIVVDKKTTTIDLSIGGPIFNDCFYYGYYDEDEANNGNGVARDYYVYPDDDPKHVPFYDAESYAEYLGSEYLRVQNEGGNALGEVQKLWDKYLYDLYDPDHSGKADSDYYMDGHTFGDSGYGWPKSSTGDKNSASGDSFHYRDGATIDQLHYDYKEEGVDYSNFISNVLKSAAAEAAGDGNTDRKYDIDILADGQAKADAPVALIFQIQTSWQMFDMNHANATSDAGNQTASGRATDNSSIATLYDIKHAMLDVIDYMENNLSSNNIVIGITETRHTTTDSMIDQNGCYVSNNYDELRKSIENWDIFGNCEHIHYGTDALDTAVAQLEDNLSQWQDFYGKEIQYDDIRKVAVVVGGATENKIDSDGLGCALTWSVFEDAEFNSVYGIRTNEGTPENQKNIVSWIDNTANNGTAFKDGEGGGFTEKIVATNREAFYQAIVDIIEYERRQKGLPLTAGDKFVTNVSVSDTIQDEFKLDPSKEIVLKMENTDINHPCSTEAAIDLEAGTVKVNGNAVSADFSPPLAEWNGSSALTVSFTGNVNYHYTETTKDPETQVETVTQHNGTQSDVPFSVTIAPGTEAGTTTVAANAGLLYNTQKLSLHFGIQAKDDYIGSNNVYTNVGTPTATYEHQTTKDEDDDGVYDVDSYSVQCFDTPMVNVPLLEMSGNGGSRTYVDTVNEYPWNIAEDGQGAQKAFAKVHDLLDNYDQTNGTLTYTLQQVDATGNPIGTAQTYSVPVVNGVPQETLLNGSDELAIFNTSVEGVYNFKIIAQFTPDAFVNNDNFEQDGKTNVGVAPKDVKLPVKITVVKSDTTLSYKVRKVWDADYDDVTEIRFQMVGVSQEGDSVNWPEDDTSLTPSQTYYVLNAANLWQTEITGLPATKNSHLLVWQAEETAVMGENVNLTDWSTTYEKVENGRWVNFNAKYLLPNDIKNEKNKLITAYLKLQYEYAGKTGEYTTEDKTELKKGTLLQFSIPMNGTDFPGEDAYALLTVTGISYSVDGTSGWESIFDPIPSAYQVAQAGNDVTVTMSLRAETDGDKVDNNQYLLASFWLKGRDEPVFAEVIQITNQTKITKDSDQETVFTITDPSGKKINPADVLGVCSFEKYSMDNQGAIKDRKTISLLPSGPLVTIDYTAPEEEFIIRNAKGGPELPSTGGSGMKPYVVLGGALMCTPLAAGFVLRRKRERRTGN